MKNTKITTAAAVLVLASFASAQVNLTQIGAQSPPTSLDGYSITPAPIDDRPFFESYDSIELGADTPVAIEFALMHFGVPDQGWRPWSHDYTGSVYFLDPGVSIQVRLRPRNDLKAVVVYIDPRDDSREFEFEIIGLAASGDESATTVAIRGEEAQGIGISVPADDNIIQITITNTDRSAGGFVIGQFLRDDGIIDECRADIDGDGELTIFDFLEFQNLFAAGDLRADFDGDGQLTIFDFLMFQNEFAEGCD